ncbi:MAG: non-ribosomal peptide synthetase, partial [Micromonosporaceae bacterium]
MADNLLALPQLPAVDRVRMVCAVPSALSALLRFPLPASVRTVLAAGENLPRSLVDQLYAQPGVTRVLNCYGPTEATVYCAAYEVPREETIDPPIGTAIARATLSVRDPRTGEPATEGELWVAGPGVTRGYLNRPEATARGYVTGPDGVRWYRTGDVVRYDGRVYHCLGRLDDQVKVRGYRVELGEVQAALLSHPAVHHAVALAPADAHGTRRLVGYVEPVSDPPDEAELRAWLRDRLPAYLLPSRIVVLDRLPIGPTGKVDRAALPVPEDARPGGTAYVAPRNRIEAVVAAAIAEALGLPEVGVEDHLLDLGGHSLTAASVVARVAGELGVPVPLAWFLAEPTAAGAVGRRPCGVAHGGAVGARPLVGGGVRGARGVRVAAVRRARAGGRGRRPPGPGRGPCGDEDATAAEAALVGAGRRGPRSACGVGHGRGVGVAAPGAGATRAGGGRRREARPTGRGHAGRRHACAGARPRGIRLGTRGGGVARGAVGAGRGALTHGERRCLSGAGVSDHARGAAAVRTHRAAGVGVHPARARRDRCAGRGAAPDPIRAGGGLTRGGGERQAVPGRDRAGGGALPGRGARRAAGRRPGAAGALGGCSRGGTRGADAAPAADAARAHLGGGVAGQPPGLRRATSRGSAGRGRTSADPGVAHRGDLRG